MPKTIWQKKVATRNEIVVCFAEPKQAATAAAHQTSAQANCIFHLRIRLEVALAVPSMAPMMATKVCCSNLPPIPRDSSRMNMEMPMAIQTALMARAIVVSGRLRTLSAMIAPVSTEAAIMVTGQASELWPQVVQAMAT